jgi:hypothetical protein
VIYHVASRGRVIGTTELDFARIGGRSRSGWFHPNAEGERLMPTVAAVLPAMRAFVHRDVRLEDGSPVIRHELEGSTLFADLAEALHHASALDLTLHREDGSLVPTELVGLQKTELPPHLAMIDAITFVSDAVDFLEDPDLPLYAEFDEYLDDDVEYDPELGWTDAADIELSDISFDPEEEDDESFAPRLEMPPLPPYQIHVMLIDDAAIP